MSLGAGKIGWMQGRPVCDRMGFYDSLTMEYARHAKIVSHSVGYLAWRVMVGAYIWINMPFVLVHRSNQAWSLALDSIYQDMIGCA